MEEVTPEQLHEEWIELGRRPRDNMSIQLVDGPLFDAIIPCLISVSKRTPGAG